MQQKCEYGTKQASMFCACDDPNFLCKVVTSIHLPFWLATVFENGDWCFLPLPPGTMSVAGLMTHQVSMIRTIISSHYLPQAGCGKYTGLGYGVVSFPHNKMWRTKWPWGWDMGVFGISKSGKHSTFVIVRRAGLLWSQQDFEWRWSVPLFKCLTVLEFSFILFDLCLLITFFNFIMNYVPIVTYWIFTYHKIWILSIMFCFIWSYWIIYFLACLEVFWSVVS